jgi:hypothetical protein
VRTPGLRGLDADYFTTADRGPIVFLHNESAKNDVVSRQSNKRLGCVHSKLGESGFSGLKFVPVD